MAPLDCITFKDETPQPLILGSVGKSCIISMKRKLSGFQNNTFAIKISAFFCWQFSTCWDIKFHVLNIAMLKYVYIFMRISGLKSAHLYIKDSLWLGSYTNIASLEEDGNDMKHNEYLLCGNCSQGGMHSSEPLPIFHRLWWAPCLGPGPVPTAMRKCSVTCSARCEVKKKMIHLMRKERQTNLT